MDDMVERSGTGGASTENGERAPFQCDLVAISPAPAATTATTAAAEAATAATRLAFLGLVHAERAAVEIGAVHLRDGALRLFRRRHHDEAEAARAAGFAVEDELCFD